MFNLKFQLYFDRSTVKTLFAVIWRFAEVKLNWQIKMLQPIIKQLNSKRIILASSSPRRKELLQNIVCFHHNLVLFYSLVFVLGVFWFLLHIIFSRDWTLNCVHRHLRKTSALTILSVFRNLLKKQLFKKCWKWKIDWKKLRAKRINQNQI